MDTKDKIRISEPHEFKIGGGNWGASCNVIKIHFFTNLTKKRATEIAHQLMAHITKD